MSKTGTITFDKVPASFTFYYSFFDAKDTLYSTNLINISSGQTASLKIPDPQNPGNVTFLLIGYTINTDGSAGYVLFQPMKILSDGFDNQYLIRILSTVLPVGESIYITLTPQVDQNIFTLITDVSGYIKAPDADGKCSNNSYVQMGSGSTTPSEKGALPVICVQISALKAAANNYNIQSAHTIYMIIIVIAVILVVVIVGVIIYFVVKSSKKKNKKNKKKDKKHKGDHKGNHKGDHKSDHKGDHKKKSHS